MKLDVTQLQVQKCNVQSECEWTLLLAPDPTSSGGINRAQTLRPGSSAPIAIFRVGVYFINCDSGVSGGLAIYQMAIPGFSESVIVLGIF